MKTRPVDKSSAVNYLKRAEQCRNSAARALVASEWDAAVIGAIHCAIASADAACIFRKGIRHASESHREAVALLLSVDPTAEGVRRAVDHLSTLLSIKTDAEYGDRLASQRDAEAAVKHAERLLAFARDTLKVP